MNKEQIISFIKEQLDAERISQEDILHIVGQPVPVQTGVVDSAPVARPQEEASKGVINTFYALGAIIVIVGTIILIGQYWDEIGFLGRMMTTLGVSLVTYSLALILGSQEQKNISQVLFTISAALAPVGVAVLLRESDMDFILQYQTITAVCLLVVFGTALYISKRNILVLITVAFGSWAYITTIIDWFDLFGYDSYESYEVHSLIMKWAVLLLGISYLFIAYGLSYTSNESEQKEKKNISNILYNLGILGILGSAISLGGVFDALFIGLVFAAFYGSVYIKSKLMLISGAGFLVGYIIKITGKYFVDSIGWPVALIGIGFMIIGVGYGTYTISKKYISGK